jgi:protein-S-isoprenylcysteine O-methyltransferase Ste14
VRAVGAVLGIGGVLLAVRAALLLAGRGRPRRGPTPAFVLAGPYVRMRNPLLAGVVLALFGSALTFGSWALAMLALATALAAHLWVTRVEEPRLERRFGAAYEEYLRSVPRWLPRRREPSD